MPGGCKRRELKDYQLQCVDAINACKEGSYIVKMAAGAGTTKTFANIERKGRILILSHRSTLNDDLEDDSYAADFGVGRIGLEWGSKHAGDAEVVCSTIQALSHNDCQRLKDAFRPGEFDTVIIDECHRSVCPSYKKIIEYLRPRLLLGFTASTERPGGRELDEVFDEVIFERDLPTNIEEGTLCDIEILAIETEWDLGSVRTSAATGELVQTGANGLSRAVDDATGFQETCRRIAKAWEEHRGYEPSDGDGQEGHQGMVFCATKKQAKAVAALIQNSAVITDGTPEKKRREILEGYRKGEVECLVDCQALAEDMDLPMTETVLLARPTKSSTLYSQMVGHAARPHTFPDGRVKKACRLVDCTRTREELGLCSPYSLIGKRVEPGLLGVHAVENGLLSQLDGRIAPVEVKKFNPFLAGGQLLRDELEYCDDTTKVEWTRLRSGKLVNANEGWTAIVFLPDDAHGGYRVACLKRGGGEKALSFFACRGYSTLEEADGKAHDWLKNNPIAKKKRDLWEKKRTKKDANGPMTGDQAELLRELLGSSSPSEDRDVVEAAMPTMTRRQAVACALELLDAKGDFDECERRLCEDEEKLRNWEKSRQASKSAAG